MPLEEDSKRNYSSGYDGQHAATQDVYDEPTVDPVYRAKARILNDALQDIGMGRYQASLLSSPIFGTRWLTPSV